MFLYVSWKLSKSVLIPSKVKNVRFYTQFLLLPGTDKQGYGFGGTGKKSFGRQFDSYGEVLIKSNWLDDPDRRMDGQMNDRLICSWFIDCLIDKPYRMLGCSVKWFILVWPLARTGLITSVNNNKLAVSYYQVTYAFNICLFAYSHLESMTLLDATLIWIVALSNLAKMVRIIINLFFLKTRYFTFLCRLRVGINLYVSNLLILITSPYYSYSPCIL